MRAVQDDDMIGIDDILEMLQPVAGHDLRAAAADAAVVGIDELARVEDFQALVARQHRFLLGWAHIGEGQSVKFLHGIPRLTHAITEAAAFGFAGLLQAAAFTPLIGGVIINTLSVPPGAVNAQRRLIHGCRKENPPVAE